MEGLQEVTNALSNGTIPDRIRPHFPRLEVRNPTHNSNRYYLSLSGTDKAIRTSNLASTFTGSM